MKMRNATITIATVLMAAGPTFAAGTISAQDASISAAGNIITAERLPVQIGTGAPTYLDVTITLSGVESGAVITGVKASATSKPSVIPYTDKFVAGTYKDANGNIYTIAGPGVGPGGATAWSISHVSGTKNCVLTSATWYTDTGSNNPEYVRLNAAKISTTAYSFGVAGGESNCGGNYGGGHLVGAMQSNNIISISSYSDGFGHADNTTPVATLQFTAQ
jgi:hypothetical protein